MANGFGAIENGLSAIRAFRAATETISHNIANAATEGYSRQETMLVARPAATYFGYNSVGGPHPANGVDVERIRRYRDPFLDRRFREANAELGRLGVSAASLGRIEQTYNEPGESGIAGHLNAFFQAWQDVANNPEASSARAALLERSQSLALRFNQAAAAVRAEQQHLDLVVNERVREVNDFATRIATLNGKIALAQGLGQSPNDLLDQRDRELDGLSKLAGITVSEQPDGTVTITLGGRALVTGTTTNALAAVTVPATGFRQVVWAADNAAVALTSGELFGAVSVRDGDLANQLTTLNTLASALITQVNTLHAGGFGLNGATGLPFFTGTDATTMAVNPALLANPQAVAAAGTLADLPGDNAVALQLAALAEAQTMNGGTTTFGGFWNTFIAQLGVAVNHARTEEESQRILQGQLVRERASVAGVSLDEEAAHLVRFQRSFEAAAHVIAVVDSLLGTVINEMGRAGR
ncbi:MAG: flagellar hook-associated protein FlgK [Chloroflexi bacterium]|nr:flagellar hook-associated protein FlgK [Chloroflexota bacterium]